MAYDHDIFVSYRRDPQTLLWIERFLTPMVTQRVSLELQRNPAIYVSEVTDQIQVGGAWPVDLGETVARSRVLIALWSGNYLASEWCQQELSLMLDRERKHKARTVKNKYGLVIPIVVHDGESIPGVLANAQRLDVKEYFFAHMPRDSDKAAALERLIATHAKGIADAIRKAPRWQKRWPTRAAQRLLKTFKRQQASQRTVPRHGRP